MSRTPLYSQNNFNSIPNSKTNASLSISACKKDLRMVLGKLKQLRESVNQLQSIKDELSDYAWNTKMNKLNFEKQTILDIIKKFKKKSQLENLKEMLKKRIRKRVYICRRNIRLKQDKDKKIKKRKELEKSTDEWLKKEINKSVETKQAEEASAKSNIVLYAVNRKISEAERYISLFEKLEKLRKGRNVAYPGKNCAESQFLLKINRLKCVWKDALTEYETEKRKLQLLLTKSTKSLEHQWKEVLFGEDFQNDSMNIETKSLQQFIEIRRTWDSYIVPEDYSGGTSIPLGWVMPNDEPSKLWDLYRCAE